MFPMTRRCARHNLWDPVKRFQSNALFSNFFAIHIPYFLWQSGDTYYIRDSPGLYLEGEIQKFKYRDIVPSYWPLFPIGHVASLMKHRPIYFWNKPGILDHLFFRLSCQIAFSIGREVSNGIHVFWWSSFYLSNRLLLFCFFTCHLKNVYLRCTHLHLP